MESNGLPAGMFSNMLGLEMSSLHHQQQQQQNQNQHLPPPRHHPGMVSFANHESDHNPPPQSAKQNYPFASKAKNHQLSFSDDDDAAGGGGGPEDSGGDGKRTASPWQRMKWTDSMVRLLIMVVFYIGDEVGSEGNEAPAAAAGKKKSGGVLQKKGKWKSVSRAMLERGFYVSPQQCEDKFNDLNKRYKRVNDILGKGTACRVVENQSLLDSMDHLSTKMKDEVKKLLNSKHLFFREMCAYHNSCGGGGNGGGGAGGVHHSSEMAAPAPAEGSQIQKQSCLHSSENIQIMDNLGGRADTEGSKSIKDLSDDDEDDVDEMEDDSYDEEEVVEGRNRGHGHGHGHILDDEERNSRKRVRNGSFEFNSPSIKLFSSELNSFMQDSSKSQWDKRQWMKNRLMKLEEQKVGYYSQAFEIEKQRLKWLKFSSKKEREMEAEKLTNERMRLENERMLLLLRQKEMELVDFQHLGNRRGDPPSSVTG